MPFAGCRASGAFPAAVARRRHARLLSGGQLLHGCLLIAEANDLIRRQSSRARDLRATEHLRDSQRDPVIRSDRCRDGTFERRARCHSPVVGGVGCTAQGHHRAVRFRCRPTPEGRPLASRRGVPGCSARACDGGPCDAEARRRAEWARVRSGFDEDRTQGAQGSEPECACSSWQGAAPTARWRRESPAARGP